MSAWDLGSDRRGCVSVSADLNMFVSNSIQHGSCHHMT